MKKNFIFIANWKMYLNFNQEISLATSKYDNFIKLSQNIDNKIVLCPSFLNVATIKQIFKTTKIEIGAQNCSSHHKGSFTGQISAESLNLLGIKYCIIGHSETRKNFNEDNKEITQKFIQLLDYDISPIICIGENEQDYENKKTTIILEEQLEEIIMHLKNGLKAAPYLSINIAYEPIWAIGTGKIPTTDYLENIFAWLYEKTKKLQNINFKFLYGGSVGSKNITFLKKINHLDGFLIGVGSLDFQEFKKIVELES
ncbi:MAG: triose-phosphate isomerase family protein [bacterium]